MRSRFGLTLVEVLASLVILSLVAAVCVPMLMDARRLLEDEGGPQVELADLAALVDAALAAPRPTGAATLEQPDVAQLVWPDLPPMGGEASPPRPPVQSQRLSAPPPATPTEGEARTANHEWLVFTCGDCTIVRWVEVPEPAVTEPTP